MEFKPFPKITRFNNAMMSITQKIHGTNAQILITPEGDLFTGSRTRWIYPGDDNYGFAAFVHANKDAFVTLLGPGTHYGEWCGPGINSGEGLTEKTFVLFDYWKYPAERPLPPQTRAVPVLYQGGMDFQAPARCMAMLKEFGSSLATGFMRPEGIVVNIAGQRFKIVFDAEETQWTKPSGQKAAPAPGVDYSNLLQPIRLEKLLSREERLVREFPQSLPEIVKAYFADLIEEGQVQGDEDQLKAIRKGASRQVFEFIKSSVVVSNQL